MELTYSVAGDYLLPDIVLSDPAPDGLAPDALAQDGPAPLGYYGMRHKAYLREEKPALYASLLLSERLYPLCREIDEAAATRLAAIPDREIAHEIILSELVYS
jgi:hypothetical protein